MIRRFSVSQVRSAASCPRLFYFDQTRQQTAIAEIPAVTRIWKRSDDRATAVVRSSTPSAQGFNRRGTLAGPHDVVENSRYHVRRWLPSFSAKSIFTMSNTRSSS